MTPVHNTKAEQDNVGHRWLQDRVWRSLSASSHRFDEHSF